MVFTPQSHAAWDGVSPLRGALAIESEELGTLGVGVKLAGETYFTCARHVAGRAPPATIPVGVYRTSGSYQPTQSLLRTPQEPASEAALESLDLAFLHAQSDARNVTPNQQAPFAAIGVVAPNDELHLRGCRHAGWITTTYQSHFVEEYKPFFEPLPYDLDHFGIIDLAPLGAANQQPGNSGSILWLTDAGAPQAVGHLVQVSRVKPIALIVLYRSGFDALGLGAAAVIEKV